MGRIGSIVMRVVRAVLRVVSWSITLVLALLVMAHATQDRAVWLAPATYVPLWSIGAVAVAWDLLRLGRALPLRWVLLCLGLGTTLLGVGAMWAPARSPEPASNNATSLRLMQWNVRWGGLRGQDSLRQIINEMRARQADIILISELPPEQWFLFEWNALGNSGHTLTSAGPGPGPGYWFRVGVMSRFPSRVAREWTLPAGRAVLFEIDLPQRVRPLRVLACDLESSPRVHRAPSLGAIAIIANELSRDSTPADVIAGDFNAPARAWGFADIERAADGYRRAAFWSGDWRATWPSAFAVLDIDHILVRRGVAVRSAALFTNHATDHRGQTVDLAISDAPKRSPTMRFMPKPIPEPSPRRASSR